MRFKWKRREFLRSSVIAGFLAPVAAYWPDLPEARALTEKRNLVLVFLPNGKVRENPFIEGMGSGWSYAEGFRPYNAFRDRSIAIEEYHFQSFINRHYNGDHGGHVAPGACMFTGDVAHETGGSGDGGVAPSLDQIVAWDYLDRGVISNPLRKSLPIKVTGSSFRSPSVFFQTPPDYTLNRTYSNRMQPVSMIDAPREGFDLMFGDVAMMNGGTSEDLWAQGRSILDVPSAELNRLKTNLPSEGQQIMDQHLQALRELETGLADDGSMIEPPPRPEDIARRPENHVAIMGQWWDIVDSALRLDRTRIVTVQYGGIASRFHVPELGLGAVGNGDGNSGSDHHSYTHHAGGRVPEFMDWFAQRNSELLTRLSGGGSVPTDILCDSAVMVGMEFGWNHNATDVPVTIFGELGGHLDVGKAVTYGNDIATYHKHTGTLLALAKGMGVDGLNQIGRDNNEYQQGPATELLG
ncbi:MAG: DUF1552 domain-containing protein [Myxococcota bacterium]